MHRPATQWPIGPRSSRQFDQETTFDYEVKAPQSDLNAGVRTDGVVTFGKVDPAQPLEVRFEWLQLQRQRHPASHSLSGRALRAQDTGQDRPALEDGAQRLWWRKVFGR